MTEIDAAVAHLLQIRRLGTPGQALVLADSLAAYAVQAGVASALGWFGNNAPLYWKSGAASRLGIDSRQ